MGGGWGYLNWRYQDQECPERMYPDWGNQSLEAMAKEYLDLGSPYRGSLDWGYSDQRSSQGVRLRLEVNG